jgi:mono/diheme cytochrome c family protein
MTGACRKLWTEGGVVPLTCVLVLAGLLGCGGERRSGALSADSTRPAITDTTAVSGPSDTSGAQLRDTAVARPESTVARTDSTKAVAAKPAPRKPAKTSTPKPASPPAPSGQASAARPDSTTASPQPAESAAAPAPTTEASAPLRDPYHQAPLDTVSQQVYDGWKQFNLNCARCHGEDAQGTTIAPHLIVSLKPDGPINTKELFVQTVCAGRPAKGMPSWCSLGMEIPTIEAIYAYVKGRSDAKIHPGRPAVRSGG